MRFPEEIIQTYPYPLAVSASRVNNATQSMEEYLCLVSLFETSLKYLASVSLSHYLQDEIVDEGIQEQLKKLLRPTPGAWNDILRACIRFYTHTLHKPSLISELCKIYTTRLLHRDPGTQEILVWFRFMAKYLKEKEKVVQKHVSLQQVLDLMVQYHHKIWGHRVQPLTPKFCEKHVEYFRTGMQGILKRIAFLTRYPLRYIKEVRQIKDQNCHILFHYMGVARRQSEWYTDLSIPEGRLYLCDEQGVPGLTLYPLCVIYHGHVYMLEYDRQEKGLRYRDCETGEFLGSASLSRSSLFQLIGTPANKLDELELPVPPEPEEDGLEIDETPFKPFLGELLAQFNEEGRQALEMALGEALRIGHFWLGVEFLLMALSRQDGRPLSDLLHGIGLSRSHFRGVLRGVVGIATREDWSQMNAIALGRKALPKLKEARPTIMRRGFNSEDKPFPVITPRMKTVLQEAVQLAGNGKAGHIQLLSAALQHTQCLAVNLLLRQIAESGQDLKEFLNWVKQLANHGDRVPSKIVKSPIELPKQGPGPNARASQLPLPPLLRNKGLLDRYGRDLTAEARAGRLHPAIGVDGILRRLKRILIQRENNNPLLIGEPGVGKTAIVEGLAYEWVYQGSELPELSGKRIVELSINGLIAGTKYRGELEERIEQILAEVKAAPDVIIFIDEIHTVLGGGGDSSTNLANILKPALARGEFPCIGATTIAEYRKYIEKDPALSRRFETIVVEEPSMEDTIKILKGLQQGFEDHYGIPITQSGIEAAVRLSVRYLPDERLPAKAIKLLEQAGAYTKLPSLIDLARADREEITPSRFNEVNEDVIRYLLARKTGIPLERLMGDELERIKGIAEALQAQVIGQDEAIQAVAQVIKRARAGLGNPLRPIGVFLFVGPTGVGKTELARALAGFLFHNREAMIRLDMSEYMEKHQVSRLIGAPPGYVGYEEEGQLTGPLRLRPHSVVLLDEMEKAHEEVHNLFLQLFEEGRLTDSKGRTVSGREAIFIMTSNVGSEVYRQQSMGFLPKEKLSPEWLKEKQAGIEKALRIKFKPEFLNRIDRIIHFNPLTLPDVIRIFQLQFVSIQKRLLDYHEIQLKITPEAVQYVCEEGYDTLNGARPLTRAMDRLIVEPLTDLILDGKIKAYNTVTIHYDGSQLTFEKGSIPVEIL
ncbi:MAG TPA: ATP-dependent Clp protease ATP-binding subunit [Candidatus Limnocylindrales bacterium]|nr:ATP-dependent Clp protease ATP-binding subunit [Candidatus Limnocylindrales bacterium]